jgi:alkanesulfonate monooxygenase SsuD/methylene tetrahydromethanopterin reductase-like flavin-dependent oxidoreductase (luciferase family)
LLHHVLELILDPDDLTLSMPLYVAESVEGVRDDIGPNIEHYRRLVTQLGQAALAKCNSDTQRVALKPILERLGALSFEQINDGMGCFGTPDQCHQLLAELRREFNPGRVIAWFNFGGLLPHPSVLRSMQLFARSVLPAFPH